MAGERLLIVLQTISEAGTCAGVLLVAEDLAVAAASAKTPSCPVLGWTFAAVAPSLVESFILFLLIATVIAE